MTGKTRRAFLFANVTRPQNHHFPRLRQRAAPEPPLINCVSLLRRTRTASEGSQESFAHTLQDKTLEPAGLFPAAEKMSATVIQQATSVEPSSGSQPHRPASTLWLLSFGSSFPRITEPASFSTVFATPATLLWTLVRCTHGVGEFVHGRCVVANRIAARAVHRVRTIRVLQRPIGVGNASSVGGIRPRSAGGVLVPAPRRGT